MKNYLLFTLFIQLSFFAPILCGVNIAYAEVVRLEDIGSRGSFKITPTPTTGLLQKAAQDIHNLEKTDKELEKRLKEAEKAIRSLSKDLINQTEQNKAQLIRLNELTNIIQEQYNCASTGKIFDGNTCIYTTDKP